MRRSSCIVLTLREIFLVQALPLVDLKVEVDMKKQVMVLLIASLLLGVACTNRKDESTPVGDAGRDTRAVNQLNVPRGNCSASVPQAFVQAQGSSSTFDLAVKVFISPTIDPAVFGSVSMKQGIKISGLIDRDGNNNVLMASSVLRLEVWDSWAIKSLNGEIQENIEPLLVELQGVSANVSGNNATFVFGDDLGTVTLEGQLVGSQFQAQVKFENKALQSWTPKKSDGTAYTAGTLGAVSLPSNGFFRCQ